MVRSATHPQVYDRIRASFPAHLQHVRAFLAQPSVSAEDRGVRDCAELLAARLQALGCRQTEIAETPGLPAVWAQLDAGAPATLAVYGYFDTNTVGADWDHDPFAGVIAPRAPFPQVLYGRGGSNKGGLMAFLNALEAMQQAQGALPVNLLFLCEGEEFVGSRHVPLLIERYRALLARADGALAPGLCQNAAGAVDFALGNKGCLHVEMTCSGEAWGRGPRGAPTHSSTMGVVDHPVWRLVHALATLYDPRTATITVPGFADGLRPPTEEELQLADALAQADAQGAAARIPGIGNDARVRRFVQDAAGPEVFRRYCFEPTMNINGLRAGFTGPGTALWTLPHRASCTIDHRLPPDLDPQACLQKIRDHLDRQGYADIRLEVLMAVGAQSLQPNDDLAQAALRTFGRWGVAPRIWPRRGASGPTGHFSRLLGLKTLGSTGLGYASGHSSGNEYLVIEGNEQVGGLTELTCSFADLLYSYAAIVKARKGGSGGEKA